MRWSEVPPLWAECFELGWEAFRAGSAPVGALIVAPGGDVVSRGRSRRAEVAAPAGQLAGTSLAHAEINAMAGLAPGCYPRHTLYTSLRPCLLCTAAINHCHIGNVSYAAEDPLWFGLDQLPLINAHIARRWPAWEGPISGPLDSWQTLLCSIWQLRGAPDGPALRAQQAATPDLVDLARALIADGELARLEGMPLASAFDTVTRWL